MAEILSFSFKKQNKGQSRAVNKSHPGPETELFLSIARFGHISTLNSFVDVSRLLGDRGELVAYLAESVQHRV